MTSSSAHDDFTAAAAAYAIDALDRDERVAFEAHLATCEQCRADLAEYRRVASGLGLAAESAAPRPSLKAEVLARATGTKTSGVVSSDTPGNDSRGPLAMPWWLAAAASMAFVSMALYAWSLHRQLNDVREMVAIASKEAQAARAELAAVRQTSTQLTRTLAVVTGSDTIQVQLAGQDFAKAAKGHAYWSRASQSLVFRADSLPALPAGQVYQLWVLAPTPVSVGVLTMSATGEASMTAVLAQGLPPVTAVAVTREPGPSGSQTPTMPILLVGAVKATSGN